MQLHILVLIQLLLATGSAEFVQPLLRINLWDNKQDKCTTETTHCVPIASHLNRTCLGSRLPYKLTAPHPLVEDVSRHSLQLWTTLQAIPACWDKLQFFLCSVYVPECIEDYAHSPVSTRSSHERAVNSPTGSLDIHTPSSYSSNAMPPDNGTAPRLSFNRTKSKTYRVVLPEAEMCEAVHKACPLLVPYSASIPVKGAEELSNGIKHLRSSHLLMSPLPRFLDCSLYTPGCRQNKLTARLFQSTGGDCQAPLITTTVRQNWLAGIERCSFPCRRPHFDPEHYVLARWITGCAAIICLCVNIVVLVTLHLQHKERLTLYARLAASSTSCSPKAEQMVVFSGERKSLRAHHATATTGNATKVISPSSLTRLWSPYPPLLCIHVFFLIGCLAWLMPLLPGIGELVACREDGSLRTGEPQVSSGKSIICVLNFILLYFSLVAAAVWSNILDYTLVIRIQQVTGYIGLIERGLINPDRSGSAELYPPMMSMSDGASTCYPTPVCGRNGHSTYTTSGVMRQSQPEKHVKPDSVHSCPGSEPDCSQPPSVHESEQLDQSDVKCSVASQPEVTSECDTIATTVQGSPITEMAITGETDVIRSAGIHRRSCSKHSHSDVSGAGGITQHQSDRELSPVKTSHYGRSHSQRKSKRMQALTTDPKIGHRKRNKRSGHRNSEAAVTTPTQEQIPLSRIPAGRLVSGDSELSLLGSQCRVSMANTGMRSSPADASSPSDHTAVIYDLELPSVANRSTECPLCHGHCSPPPANPLIFHAMRVSLQLNCPLPNLRPDLRAQTTTTVNSAVEKLPQAHRQRALSSPNGNGNHPAVDPGSCTDCFNNKPSVITAAGSCRHGSRGSHSVTTTFPQSACLHLLAFALPLVLTLISLTAAEIDGDSLSGVCFVGRVNIWARAGLIFIPFTVCLIVKAIYVGRLIQEFAKLRCQFSRSPFHVDQEFAHRLTRCSYSYGFFLVVLIGLWLFSCVLQTYVYLSEPVWLESQRSLVLCQLSYRLLGLNEEAALNACFNTASTGIVKAGTVGVSNMDHRTAMIGLRTARDMSSYLLKPNTTLSSDSTTTSSDHFNPAAVQTTPTTSRALFGNMDKPMAGPVLLHLCVFFVLNLIFASVCLFDQSVKRSWRNVWIRFVIKCRSRSCGPRKSRSLGIALSNRRTMDSLSSYLCNIPQGFSWWDPGLFDIPLIRCASMFAAPIPKETTLTSEFNQSAEGFASADSKRRIMNSSVAASDHHTNGLSTSHPAGMDWDSRIQSPSKVSAHCHVPHSTCDLQSNTGGNEARRDGQPTAGGEALPHEPAAGMSPFDDILPKLIQLASLYQSSSHDESTLVWLQRLYQQLTAVTMNPAMAPSSANIRTSHDTPSECASASGQASHSLEPLVNKIPVSDVNTTSHATNQPANLIPSMAAVYEQCQKQMAALTGSSRRRSRHRFLFPSRTSIRRRSHSRSMSTSGLFFPGLRATATGPGSVVSATGSDRQSSVADESLSLLQAVIAAAAATSSAAAGHGINEAVATAGSRNHRRLSHSGLPTYSAQQLDTSSGATSAFGGSQISSTSVRSGLTGVSVPPESTSERPASITGPALATECGLPSNLGDSSHPGKNGAVGSRMSLRSLSCASSSGAESYNSYRLLVNQAGASWRELWRTRMLLMDVLRWAETVAPLMQTNNQSSQSSSDVRDYPPPSFEPKVDSSTRGGKDPGRQSETGVPNISTSAIPTTAAVDWNTQFTQFVSSLLERHQQQTQQQLGPQQFSTPSQPFQTNENLNPSGVFTNPTPSVQSSSSLVPPPSAVVPPMLSLDPMMAAAFAAATAAATVALQQQQQQQQHQQNQNSQGCVSPMTGYTPATSFHQQTSATPFSSAYSAVAEAVPTYLKTPAISSPNNLQSPTAGVSRSAGAMPQGYPGIGSPPMQVYNSGSPPCMMPHFQSADCLGSSRPNFPQCAVDSRQMLVPGSAPVWAAGQFPGQNPSVAAREPVASDGSYPYVCRPQMIPPGHRGPPDLLADHDREAGARMTGISPKCSPPYVTPNTCFEPGSGQPLLSATPPWKGYWQYPVRQANPNYPGPAHFISGNFRLEDVAPSARGGFEPPVPDPNVGPTAQSFPVPSTNTAEENAGANQRSSNVAMSRGNQNESNDSDAFDSEDEVISVTDDEQACDRVSDDGSKSNGFHIAPVGATAADGQNMNEVGAPPLGAGLFAFGSVLNGSPYNCNSPTNFPNPLPSTHSNFFGLPVQQQQAECMQPSNYPRTDSPPPPRSRFSPSSYMGAAGADDGEVSSVSQSASQVVPRASSSSSSSSSVSPSPLLRLSRLQECQQQQQQPTPPQPALVVPRLSSSVENESNCKQQQNIDNKPVV